MANIIIKTDDIREYEEYVLQSFRNDCEDTPGDREAAEYVAARSKEAYSALKKMEDRNIGYY